MRTCGVSAMGPAFFVLFVAVAPTVAPAQSRKPSAAQLQPPAAVSVVAGAGAAIVSWQTAPGVAAYRVQRSERAFGGFADLATLSGTASRYEDRTVAIGGE